MNFYLRTFLFSHLFHKLTYQTHYEVVLFIFTRIENCETYAEIVQTGCRTIDKPATHFCSQFSSGDFFKIYPCLSENTSLVLFGPNWKSIWRNSYLICFSFSSFAFTCAGWSLLSWCMVLIQSYRDSWGWTLLACDWFVLHMRWVQMAQRMNILLYRDVESLWMTIIFPLSTKETNMELNSFSVIYIYW